MFRVYRIKFESNIRISVYFTPNFVVVIVVNKCVFGIWKIVIIFLASFLLCKGCSPKEEVEIVKADNTRRYSRPQILPREWREWKWQCGIHCILFGHLEAFPFLKKTPHFYIFFLTFKLSSFTIHINV